MKTMFFNTLGFLLVGGALVVLATFAFNLETLMPLPSQQAGQEVTDFGVTGQTASAGQNENLAGGTSDKGEETAREESSNTHTTEVAHNGTASLPGGKIDKLDTVEAKPAPGIQANSSDPVLGQTRLPAVEPDLESEPAASSAPGVSAAPPTAEELQHYRKRVAQNLIELEKILKRSY